MDKFKWINIADMLINPPRTEFFKDILDRIIMGRPGRMR